MRRDKISIQDLPRLRRRSVALALASAAELHSGLWQITAAMNGRQGGQAQQICRRGPEPAPRFDFLSRWLMGPVRMRAGGCCVGLPAQVEAVPQVFYHSPSTPLSFLLSSSLQCVSPVYERLLHQNSPFRHRQPAENQLYRISRIRSTHA